MLPASDGHASTRRDNAPTLLSGHDEHSEHQVDGAAHRAEAPT
ncbi:hypothetical protein ADILRU_1281 [Leifsonia rubra CMS 76R]|nr:hypothetical protein ADILRU_1281 [Leifsonia rubra CMS 76R]